VYGVAGSAAQVAVIGGGGAAAAAAAAATAAAASSTSSTADAAASSSAAQAPAILARTALLWAGEPPAPSPMSLVCASCTKKKSLMMELAAAGIKFNIRALHLTHIPIALDTAAQKTYVSTYHAKKAAEDSLKAGESVMRRLNLMLAKDTEGGLEEIGAQRKRLGDLSSEQYHLLLNPNTKIFKKDGIRVPSPLKEWIRGYSVPAGAAAPEGFTPGKGCLKEGEEALADKEEGVGVDADMEGGRAHGLRTGGRRKRRRMSGEEEEEL
jgi:hypothetical protein